MNAVEFYREALNSNVGVRSFLRERVPEIEKLERLDDLTNLKLDIFNLAHGREIDIYYRANAKPEYQRFQLLPYLEQHLGEGKVRFDYNVTMGEYVGMSFGIKVASSEAGEVELPTINLRLQVRTNEKIKP